MKQKRGGKKGKEKNVNQDRTPSTGRPPTATVNNEILGLEQAGQR
jgi:hypothetical protein